MYVGMGASATSAKLIDTSGITLNHGQALLRRRVILLTCYPVDILLRAAIATSVSFSGGPICGRVIKSDGLGMWLGLYLQHC